MHGMQFIHDIYAQPAQVQLSTLYIYHEYFTKIYKPVFTGLKGIGGASKTEITLSRYSNSKMKELTLNTVVNGSKSTSKIVELTKKQTDIIIN